jgi:uncharacterized repeat protein (TIGR03803 family)
MLSKRFLVVLFACAGIFGLQSALAWAGSTEQVLLAFNYFDGAQPFSGSLVFDSAGNLYGTTSFGYNPACPEGCGTVFELTPGSNGTWTHTILHGFKGGSDGFQPDGTLIFDAAGNLYGVTSHGGNESCPTGCGTVYKLAPGADGKWIKSILHSFSGQDGAFPLGGLTLDSAGNLYGTTWQGGSYQSCPQSGCGVVFKLTPGRHGQWTETVLLAFNGSDGSQPSGTLSFDASGNLYGVTPEGGNYTACPSVGCGVVFELAPGTKGQWTETVLHAFSGRDGFAPIGTLVFDVAGNLYGATSNIGESYGMVFELSPGTGGTWTLTVLHVFTGKTAEYPTGVTLDAKGNLYGTTAESSTGDGIVYVLTGISGGKPDFKILHFFNANDGNSPQAAPILDAAGNLYGTTFWGGNLNDCANGCGVVFEITR